MRARRIPPHCLHRGQQCVEGDGDCDRASESSVAGSSLDTQCADEGNVEADPCGVNCNRWEPRVRWRDGEHQRPRYQQPFKCAQQWRRAAQGRRKANAQE